MSKTVVYQGPIDAVEIAETGQVATRGVPIDVRDDVAANLVAQGTEWPFDATGKRTPVAPDPKTAVWRYADKPKTAPKEGE